jgi:hypothetical protein
VLAVDTNLVAIDRVQDNARTAGVDARVTAVLSDGMPPAPPDPWPARRGQVALALVNPPTHAERGQLAALLAGVLPWMAPDAPVFVVVSRAGVSRDALRAAGARIRETVVDSYTILEARRST